MREHIFHVYDYIYYAVPQICNFTCNGEISTKLHSLWCYFTPTNRKLAPNSIVSCYVT